VLQLTILAALKITRAKAQNIIFVASALSISGALVWWQAIMLLIRLLLL
jgi:hypothetical protein